MNRYSLSLLFLIFCTLLTNKMVAQVTTGYDNFSILVNDKCLIAINTSPSAVSMNMSTSAAGSKISAASNSNTYLKVTSIVSSGTTRKISAIITSGTVPPYTILKLATSSCNASYCGGSVGTAVTTAFTLSKTSSYTVVDGIGSCYSGTATTAGFRLTFSWVPDDANYSRISATTDDVSVIITFTIDTSN
jgi:hypothetical protein